MNICLLLAVVLTRLGNAISDGR